MAVADAASLRTVAVQLRSLSADGDNQPIIAREDGCMRALAGFVVGDDIEVAAIAVAALKNLASHPDNFNVMRLEEGLLDGLKDLLVSEDADRELRQDIFDILEELTDENNDDEIDDLDDMEKAAGLKEKAVQSGLDDDPNLLKEPITARLHIPGITDEVFCVRVEQLVIRKRGVISVAFEMGAEVAVVFTRLPADQLASFLTTMTGTKVELLPEAVEEDEEDEEEQQQHTDANFAKSADKENGHAQGAGYLDAQRLQEKTRTTGKKKHTITQGASSLHERLKAQREEESRRKARANRLMDSIGRGMRSGWGMW